MNEKNDLQIVLDKYATHPDFIGVQLFDVNQRGATADALLHIAARKGDVEAIRVLARYGADINLPGDLANTPLHFAAMAGRFEAVMVLSSLGASRKLQNEFGEAPMIVAKNGGHLALMEALK